MSWTPSEYKALLKGAQHKQIDSFEFMAKEAMAHAYASNAKRPKERRIFDADKARKNLENGGLVNNDDDIQEMLELNKLFKGFNPRETFRKKGG